ncbi:MAG: 50S ribosomal protein L10 [Candidatus Zambryskibacteria bacterium]|nr:50S ribosomal protein L10 [Candidatus Zambryskibacteria bacterium]
MAITRAKKGEVVDKLKNAFKNAKSLVFVNFKGLTVGNTTDMRRKLKGEGVSYTVAKKTLTKRVLEDAKYDGDIPELPGELSLAWGEDLVAPAREIYAFQKKFKDNLNILGGVFEGRYMSKQEMEGIAMIPTLEVLRGKFVNVINSPIQRWVIALGQIAEKKAQ